MRTENNLWKLLSDLEREITRLEEENIALKNAVRQAEDKKILQSAKVIQRVDWVELESGKRFLTRKELAKYLGMGAGTIANQLSSGIFPIRPRRVGRSVRFDMREVLEYLETDKPFWERDRESKHSRK